MKQQTFCACQNIQAILSFSLYTFGEEIINGLLDDSHTINILCKINEFIFRQLTLRNSNCTKTTESYKNNL